MYSYCRISSDFRDLLVKVIGDGAECCRRVKGSQPLPTFMDECALVLKAEDIIEEGTIEEVLDGIEQEGNRESADRSEQSPG